MSRRRIENPPASDDLIIPQHADELPAVMSRRYDRLERSLSFPTSRLSVQRLDETLMKVNTATLPTSTALVICLLTQLQSDEPQPAPPSTNQRVPLISPAASTSTGLLLETPLDISKVTREDFIEMMSTIGREKIAKPWTDPIVNLPAHMRQDVEGLTFEEVKAYMFQARRLFDAGEAIPVSDVGLISTQEDIIRQPMLNHIAGFQNDVARVYLLVQRTASDHGWSYFSIVQDMTLDPPLDYFAQVLDPEPVFYGQNCYKCHSSGPLAIHPAREDLVIDAQLAAEVSQFIADQPRSRFYFPESDPMQERGAPLPLEFCSECHAEDGIRGPLFQEHSHPMRILVDFGYMPPDRRLTRDEVSQLKSWLEAKAKSRLR